MCAKMHKIITQLSANTSTKYYNQIHNYALTCQCNTFALQHCDIGTD